MIARTSFTAEEARMLGRILGVHWDRSPFGVHDFRRCLDLELEHGRSRLAAGGTAEDPIRTARNALARLRESADYAGTAVTKDGSRKDQAMTAGESLSPGRQAMSPGGQTGTHRVFTKPWPGPGDSEGPVDPEASVWTATEAHFSTDVPAVLDDPSALFTAPWPGPGNSEGEGSSPWR